MAAEVGVNNWLRMVRGVLAQLENRKRRDENVYGMDQEEVWRLTRKMEIMKRDGIWGRPPNEDHRGTGAAEVESTRNDAVQILPEEIWLKIMNELNDPADLLNCDKTCQLFEKILRPWKSGWLLEQALPFIYRHLSKDEILRCRLVCRSWNKAIDNFLETHPSLRPYREEEGYYKRLDFVCPLKEKQLYQENVFVFCNDPQRDNSAILEEERFKKKDQNPFIGRYVQIKLGNQNIFNMLKDDDREDAWWDRLYQFLARFGKEILSLNLRFPLIPDERLKNKLISFMESFLFQSMPNLRRLTIDVNDCRFTDTPLTTELLPEAPMLETLELVGFDMTGLTFNNMFHSLVSKYAFRQIKKLRIGGVNFVSVRGMNFENLEELILDVGGKRTSSVFEQLNAFSEYKMEKLSKVHLIFPFFYGEYFFEDLADFVNTLTAITRLSCVRIAGRIRKLRFGTDVELGARLIDKADYNYNPTSIKNMEVDLGWISIVTEPPCMHFTFLPRYFPQLKNLSIFSRGTSPACQYLQYDSDLEVDMLNRDLWKSRATLDHLIELQEDAIVQLHRYIRGGDMYESIVWEMMSHLMILTVQWDVFTREGYEANLQSRREMRAKN